MGINGKIAEYPAAKNDSSVYTQKQGFRELNSNHFILFVNVICRFKTGTGSGVVPTAYCPPKYISEFSSFPRSETGRLC